MKKFLKTILTSTLFLCIIFTNLSTFAAEELKVEAEAAIIAEPSTGKIIYETESEEQNYPASVTKILTAILVLENCKLDDVATCSQTALSNIPSAYVVAPLMVGEEMRVEDLLYALMLKSANDAAYVLAEHVGKTTEGFSEMMNNKAKEIGCKGTHFVNPNGVHSDDHYTTAYDMYLIAKYAMQNEEFRKIVSTEEYTLPATNKYTATDRVMKNTNYFLNKNSKFYNENVKGIKTGTTTQAGNCLVTDFEKDGIEFIAVILGAKTSDSKFTETEKMLDYAYENYEFTKMHDKDDVIRTVEIKKATKDTKDLVLLIDDTVEVLKKKEISKDDITPDIKINDNLEAPISKGQEIGTITYKVEDIEYSAKLIAGRDVVKKTYYKEIGMTFLALIVILFIIRTININKRKRRKKRR